MNSVKFLNDITHDAWCDGGPLGKMGQFGCVDPKHSCPKKDLLNQKYIKQTLLKIHNILDSSSV